MTKWLLQQLFYRIILCNVHRRTAIVLWAPRVRAVLQQQRDAICNTSVDTLCAQRVELKWHKALLIYHLWLTDWVEFNVQPDTFQSRSHFRQLTALISPNSYQPRHDAYFFVSFSFFLFGVTLGTEAGVIIHGQRWGPATRRSPMC